MSPLAAGWYEFSDGSTVHVHVTPSHEIARDPAGDLWCFGCRKRLPHEWVWTRPNDPMSYYGPSVRRECSGCKRDRSQFPGCEGPYEWEADA